MYKRQGQQRVAETAETFGHEAAIRQDAGNRIQLGVPVRSDERGEGLAQTGAALGVCLLYTSRCV